MISKRIFSCNCFESNVFLHNFDDITFKRLSVGVRIVGNQDQLNNHTLRHLNSQPRVI